MVSLGRTGPAETGVGGLVGTLGDLNSGRGRDEVLSRASNNLLSMLGTLRGSMRAARIGSVIGDFGIRGMGLRCGLAGG